MTGLRAVRLTLWGVVALIVAALAAFAFGGLGTRLSREGVQASAVGGPFRLTDDHGREVTEADLRGSPTLLYFGYTFCPDVCPTTLSDMTRWLASLGPDADRLKAYFVTVDPERDTGKVVADYVSAFDPRIRGLTGPPEAVAAMAKAYRVYYRKVPGSGGDYTVDHASAVYLLDRDGRFVGTIAYQEDDGTALAKIRRQLGS